MTFAPALVVVLWWHVCQGNHDLCFDDHYDRLAKGLGAVVDDQDACKVCVCAFGGHCFAKPTSRTHAHAHTRTRTRTRTGTGTRPHTHTYLLSLSLDFRCHRTHCSTAHIFWTARSSLMVSCRAQERQMPAHPVTSDILSISLHSSFLFISRCQILWQPLAALVL